MEKIPFKTIKITRFKYSSTTYFLLKTLNIHSASKHFASSNHNLLVKYHFSKVIPFSSFFFSLSLFFHFGHFFSRLTVNTPYSLFGRIQNRSREGEREEPQIIHYGYQHSVPNCPGGEESTLLRVQFIVFKISFSSFSFPLFPTAV